MWGSQPQRSHTPSRAGRHFQEFTEIRNPAGTYHTSPLPSLFPTLDVATPVAS